ncbi:HlyD family efflux transporter periplasmic adaptor subunit [Macrococcus sp. EM39E]|uniref:HlyD family efflux transporter periplasmic adaptor subunit n=1 Tax=Macrococcus animalis TaxID=3395467 RepID=UPI0039BEFE42
MKKNKWFLPVILSLIVLGIVLASVIFLYLNQQDKKNTIEIDKRIKTHVMSLDGKVKQNLSTYFQKGGQKEPVLMHVKLGDTVQKGDPLFTYTDETLFSKEKEIGLTLDNKMIEKDQIEGQILAMEMIESDTSTGSRLDEIEAQLNWLDSELSKAENNIDILKEKQEQISSKIDELTVKASADGKVAKLNKAQIERFSENTQTVPILTLSDEKFFVEGTTSRKQIDFLEQDLKFEAKHKLNKDSIYHGVIDSFETVAVKPEAKEQRFLYQAGLDNHKGLYVGDKVKVKVNLSFKDHVWLPENYIKKKIVTHKDKKKLQTPEKHYFVSKIYGDQLNEEKVTVKRHVNGQYLVTDGLSSIDAIRAFEK